ncbi:hypothetical protein [Plasmodium yoelii yoelii]|uniref:Uncharacterized protein n=1 Tax=Plasmodium yoelii yoelii TaxID=73239 RepID=Q7RFP8_PLAYO|nr:hypothetical protein [Plasmodium yoelii yoelii]
MLTRHSSFKINNCNNLSPSRYVLIKITYTFQWRKNICWRCSTRAAYEYILIRREACRRCEKHTAKEQKVNQLIKQYDRKNVKTNPPIKDIAYSPLISRLRSRSLSELTRQIIFTN